MERLSVVEGWELGRKHNPDQTLETCAPPPLTCCVASCRSLHPPYLRHHSVIVLSLDTTISLGTGTIFCNASLSTNAILMWIITNNRLHRHTGCGRSRFPPVQLSKSIARELTETFLLGEILEAWALCTCVITQRTPQQSVSPAGQRPGAESSCPL